MEMTIDYRTPPDRDDNLRIQKIVAASVVVMGFFAVSFGSGFMWYTQTVGPGVYAFVGGWICVILGLVWYRLCRMAEES